MRPRLLLICVAALILASAGGAGIVRATHVAATTSTLSVVGNHLVDNGSTVILRGVNRSGAEYACFQGFGFSDGPTDDASIAAIAAWGVNAVRVPFNESCWLGINGVPAQYAGANYQAAIVGFVSRLRAHGLYVILDNQFGGPGTTEATTILPMPDADHAPSLWTSVANTFKSDKGVIFDLYNEAHDVSWSCWANGCLVTGGYNWVANYQAAGMISLTSAIRATGATNVIMIGGLSWNYDPSGWLANKPNDGQLMVSVHNYGASGWDTPAIWDSKYAAIATQVPITIGETGFDGYIETIMPWADAHGVGYLAWTWDTWGNNQALVSNYNGTPTTYGTNFKNYLAGLPKTSPTPTPPAPTVASVAPSTGPSGGGTSVTITGTNLTGATGVKFGSAAAGTFTVNSSTQVTATSPPGSGTVDVTVMTTGGTSATSMADKFTYLPTMGAYTAVTPVRLMDTRITGGPIGPGASRNLAVAGVGSVPLAAIGVVVNVTVTNTTATSFLTVFPAGTTQPNASNLNWVVGTTIANLVTVQVASGAIAFFNSAGSTDVIVDVAGFFSAPNGNAGGEVALTPARITDTRPGSGEPNAGMTLSGGTTLNVQVTGAGGVPVSGVSAAILNVTVTRTSATSFLTVWPKGVAQPNSSNLNWSAGQTIPNRVFVPVGAGGQVSIYNAGGSADVIVDVSGYFTDATASGKLFTPRSPIRLADTRGTGQTLGTGGTFTLQVSGMAGVPSGASAVIINVTVTNTTFSSFLTVYPSTKSLPTASDLNWVAGQTIPNMVVATLGTTGAITFYNGGGMVDVIVDLAGWYG